MLLLLHLIGVRYGWPADVAIVDVVSDILRRVDHAVDDEYLSTKNFVEWNVEPIHQMLLQLLLS